MSTAFTKAFTSKAKQAFDKAKKTKHKAGKSFGPADVPNGSFTAVVSVQAKVGSKGKTEGVPIVTFTTKIDSGTHKDKTPEKAFFCHGHPPVDEGSDERPTDEQIMMGLIGFLLPDMDVEDLEISQVEQAFEIINERGPRVEIGIKNNTGTNGKAYQNVFYNKLLEPATLIDLSEPTDDEVDAEVGDDPDDLSDDTTDYAYAKGDAVTCEDQPGEWKINSVSQSRRLANIVNGKGTKVNNVSWDALTII